MIHALSVDVEDYVNSIARDWLGRPEPPTDAVVRNTHRLLELFAEHDVRGTFFILGEVAEVFPQLIRDITAQNHELGVHGYHHKQVFKLDAAGFAKEVRDARARVEDITGRKVPGHRAPAFSITPETRWALNILAELGFEYDSSVYPVAGSRYGWPGFPLDIRRIALQGTDRMIVEVPLTTMTLLGRRLPACGGGYLRHYPYRATRWAMRRCERHRPAIVYVHPYELDTAPHNLDVSTLTPRGQRRLLRLHRRQMRNRKTVVNKLARLFREFRFAPIGNVIANTLDTAAPPLQSHPWEGDKARC